MQQDPIPHPVLPVAEVEEFFHGLEAQLNVPTSPTVSNTVMTTPTTVAEQRQVKRLNGKQMIKMQDSPMARPFTSMIKPAKNYSQRTKYCCHPLLQAVSPEDPEGVDSCTPNNSLLSKMCTMYMRIEQHGFHGVWRAVSSWMQNDEAFWYQLRNSLIASEPTIIFTNGGFDKLMNMNKHE